MAYPKTWLVEECEARVTAARASVERTRASDPLPNVLARAENRLTLANNDLREALEWQCMHYAALRDHEARMYGSAR